MADRYKNEIIKLTAAEVLLSIADLATPFFESNSIYRKSTLKYKESREIEKSQFWGKIAYLRQQGYIDSFVKDKEKYYELTPKGRSRAEKLKLVTLTIIRPKKWDHKWRVIIFDVPRKLNVMRDGLRNSLKKIGFVKIQDSVYVHPFECATEVKFIAKSYRVSDHVLIMISEIIQGEEGVIAKLIKKGVLNKNDLAT